MTKMTATTPEEACMRARPDGKTLIQKKRYDEAMREKAERRALELAAKESEVRETITGQNKDAGQ